MRRREERQTLIGVDSYGKLRGEHEEVMERNNKINVVIFGPKRHEVTGG
jgi:hypothetical protein